MAAHRCIATPTGCCCGVPLRLVHHLLLARRPARVALRLVAVLGEEEREHLRRLPARKRVAARAAGRALHHLHNAGGGEWEGGRGGGGGVSRCWEAAQFSQPIGGSAELIDDRSRNRFTGGRHFENFRTWSVGRRIDICDPPRQNESDVADC